jgi:hypothetical protein
MPGLAWTSVLLFVLSCVAEMSDAHHCNSVIGWDGVSGSFCPGWPQTVILLLPISQLARITSVSYPTLPELFKVRPAKIPKIYLATKTNKQKQVCTPALGTFSKPTLFMGSWHALLTTCGETNPHTCHVAQLMWRSSQWAPHYVVFKLHAVFPHWWSSWNHVPMDTRGLL